MPGIKAWVCLNPDGARDEWIPLKGTPDGEVVVESAQSDDEPDN